MKGPKSGIVTASFRADGGVPTFQEKSCILLISVGQDYHEDEEFAATIELVNKSRFASCTIMIADTLQRHNLSSELSEVEAYYYSLKKGDDWILRNSNRIAKIEPKLKIVRWDECLRDRGLNDLRKRVEDRYHSDEEYHDAVNATISKFIERIKKRNQDGSVDLDLVFSGCLKYLLEECPIIMPLWASQGFDFVIYPQMLTAAMAKTREIFVQPDFPNKVQWLSLKFKRRNLESFLRVGVEENEVVNVA